MRQQLGAGLARSDSFAVVQRSELATFVLHIEVDEIGKDTPRPLTGVLKLFDYNTALEVYSRPLKLQDITSTADLRIDVSHYIDDLEDWLRERE